ncbi:MAG: hypothetical protein LBS74_05855 [Oscillospiraceae bacterium]|jgi:hypothetical protein|nr:hypothetical protein [Oscillospiraceae bacterium]
MGKNKNGKEENDDRLRVKAAYRVFTHPWFTHDTNAESWCHAETKPGTAGQTKTKEPAYADKNWEKWIKYDKERKKKYLRLLYSVFRNNADFEDEYGPKAINFFYTVAQNDNDNKVRTKSISYLGRIWAAWELTEIAKNDPSIEIKKAAIYALCNGKSLKEFEGEKNKLKPRKYENHQLQLYDIMQWPGQFDEIKKLAFSFIQHPVCEFSLTANLPPEKDFDLREQTIDKLAELTAEERKNADKLDKADRYIYDEESKWKGNEKFFQNQHYLTQVVITLQKRELRFRALAKIEFLIPLLRIITQANDVEVSKAAIAQTAERFGAEADLGFDEILATPFIRPEVYKVLGDLRRETALTQYGIAKNTALSVGVRVEAISKIHVNDIESPIVANLVNEFYEQVSADKSEENKLLRQAVCSDRTGGKHHMNQCICQVCGFESHAAGYYKTGVCRVCGKNSNAQESDNDAVVVEIDGKSAAVAADNQYKFYIKK